MIEPSVWVEIDLAAYGHNIRELRRITRSGARLMAVVKADGYGHGAVRVAREALLSGAEWLGVARVEEAVELRESGIDAPMLIFGFTAPAAVDRLIDYDLSQAVFSYDAAAALSSRATAKGKRIRSHLKVDTGMGRLGPSVGKSAAGAEEIAAIAALSGLELEGIFTHFATADSADKSHARFQLQRFLDLIESLERRKLEFPLRHAANSAALLDMPDSHLDMVRPGIATYGLYPSDEAKTDRVALRPVLEWKTRIVQLKKVPAGFGVSYGITYSTPRPTTLATVAVGYADGLSRQLSSRGHMLVGGRRVPIVGRVCMDLTVLDVGEVEGVASGNEVVILGRQGDSIISAGEMASSLNTIHYEIVSTITARVPRVYLNGGEDCLTP